MGHALRYLKTKFVLIIMIILSAMNLYKIVFGNANMQKFISNLILTEASIF